MARAIIYTDFDGVLNAFPAPTILRRGGQRALERLDEDDPRRRLYALDNAFELDGNALVRIDRANAYRVHWSHELTDALYDLARTGAVELRWLSTWQPFTALLDARLGWDPNVVGTVQWYDPVTYTGMLDGKYRAVERRVEMEANGEDPLPIVWIDDEECTQARCDELRRSAPVAPVLMVRPDDRIGISRRQWDLIRSFIANPRAFGDVTLDVEPTLRERAGHLGL